MFHGELHEDEELLQLRVVVSHRALTHGRFDQTLDGDLEHVQQVGPLYEAAVSEGGERRRGEREGMEEGKERMEGDGDGDGEGEGRRGRRKGEAGGGRGGKVRGREGREGDGEGKGGGRGASGRG